MKNRVATATFVALPTLDELRRFVRQILCEHDRLDVGAAPLLEAPIFRKGVECGKFFEVHGPRLLRSHAIWAAPEHRILFYDSTGMRFAEVRLIESPVLESSLSTAA